MASFEGNNFGNLDPADFGEPTPETRARFEHALDSLKQLAANKTTIEVDDVIGDADVEGRYGVSRDDLCPITQYHYDQLTDPLFGPSEDVYLMFQLTDGDSEKFHNWKDIIAHYPLHGIHYESSEIEIYYDAWFGEEMLYVTEPKGPVPSIFSDEFAPMMLGRVIRHMQAVKVGASKPTEGGMRKLIEVIEQEVAKRIMTP